MQAVGNRIVPDGEIVGLLRTSDGDTVGLACGAAVVIAGTEGLSVRAADG